MERKHRPSTKRAENGPHLTGSYAYWGDVFVQIYRIGEHGMVSVRLPDCSTHLATVALWRLRQTKLVTDLDSDDAEDDDVSESESTEEKEIWRLREKIRKLEARLAEMEAAGDAGEADE